MALNAQLGHTMMYMFCQFLRLPGQKYTLEKATWAAAPTSVSNHTRIKCS